MIGLRDIYDAVVVGGGVCGYAAAAKLAQQGASVLLVERRPALGWEGTWAFRLDWSSTSSSIGARIAERVQDVGGLARGRLDAPILEMVLDREAAAMGLDVLLYACPVGLTVTDNQAAAVVVAGKSGEITLRAKAFVDATEDGFLWRLTGVPFDEPSAVGGVFSMYLNGVQNVPSDPADIGELGGAQGVVLKPSVWPGEAALDFETPQTDIRVARRMMPELLKAARDAMDGLAGANVTHVGVEPFPLATARLSSDGGAAHPEIRNLFGAGPWSSPSEAAHDLATRFQIGESAGDVIGSRLSELAVPPKADHESPTKAAPPVFESDVLVCGGGTAGAFAAIAAACGGAKTTLIEPTTFLGGIGSGGGIHSYYHGVKGGIQDEADERLAEMTPLFCPSGKAQGFHPEPKKVVLQQMADEAGVDLVFDTVVTGVETEEAKSELPATPSSEPMRQITGVIAAGPDGNALYRARVVVDSTGDADVAVMAGVPFTFGRDADNLPHAFSQPAGRIDGESKLLITNFDAGYCDPTDIVDLTRARRLGLSHLWRDKVEASKRFVYIAPLIGLRNSRQIQGEYRLTFSDEVSGREFPDVIAYARSHFDNHGFDYENESDEAMFWVWVLGNWRRQFGCEIPYRCLLPRGVDGLLVACRAISITHDAHNQLRMQRDMQLIGEAAGTAAALSVQAGVEPRDLPIQDLQKALFDSGAIGPRERPKLPEPGEPVEVHDSTWNVAQPPARPIDEWARELGGEETQEATWQLVRAGAEAVPLLKEALKSDQPAKRQWAATALAMLRQPEAVPELMASVKERRTDAPEGHKAAPFWQSGVCLLGRVGSNDALPVLLDVLRDRDTSLDALVAAIRAVGRIGDASAAPDLETLLTRDDLPTVRDLQVSTAAAGGSVKEDALWQIELAAAEALARFGSPRPDVIARCQKDPRAYVRRYADRLAREADDAARS